VGKSATGCTQGDPLATLFFCVGIDSLYRELAAILKEEELRCFRAENEIAEDVPLSDAELVDLQSSSGGIVAIVDDVSILGKAQAVFRAVQRAEVVYADHDLELNVRKCWILGRVGLDAEPDPPNGVVLKTTGGKILGRPVGSLEYQREWITAKTQSTRLPQQALSRLPYRVQLTLIRSVFNRRFDYLAKVVSPAAGDAILGRYDAEIDDALWSLGASQSRDELRTIRALPFHLGGLSIPRIIGDRCTRNRKVTRARTAALLSDHLPHLFAVYKNPTVQQLMYGEDAAVEQLEEEDVDRIDWTDPELVAATTREQVAADELIAMRLLHARLIADGRHGHAARLLSTCVKGASKWLTSSWVPEQKASSSRTVASSRR
jgi:hypothetical protein